MNREDESLTLKRILAKYTEREQSGLDELRELDREANRPATVFGYVWGSIGAIVMGSGMSLVMTDLSSMLGIADGMIPGIIIGVVGLGISLLTYPIYKRILASRRGKYAPEILELSRRLLGEIE